jgi:hypothetical protein
MAGSQFPPQRVKPAEDPGSFAPAFSSTIATPQQAQEYWLMFGFRTSVKCAAALLSAALLAASSPTLQAQQKRRGASETNANRQARIQRTIQDTYSHRYEVAGGGGYLRFRPGQTLQRNNEVSFWGTGTRFFTSNPKLGAVADVRGYYGNAKVGNTPFNIPNPQISQYMFQGGVSYRVYTRLKYAVSVYGVGGGTLGHFSTGSKGIPASELHLWQDGWRPVVSAGANFDFNFYPNLAVRISPTYVGTLFRLAPSDTVTNKGSIQNNLGFNVGVVYRFGRIK